MTALLTTHARVSFLGVPLDNLKHDEIVIALEAALRERARVRIEGLNVAKLIQAQSDPPLLRAITEAELVHIDGAGIYFGSRVLGLNYERNYAGIDLMADLLQMCNRHQLSVYFLGAHPEVIAATVAAVQQTYSQLIISGYHHGYFNADDEADLVRDIAQARPHLLLIGISSPKKELFLNRHWDQIDAGVAMGVGGSFDVLAGIVSRAPRWMRRCGMEWLYRLIQEPRRMWRRYLVTNTKFLWLIIKHRFQLLAKASR